MKEIEVERLKFKRYKGITQLELRAKEAIIEKQSHTYDDMKFEIKSLKTAIGIPRVRNQMKFHDFQGLDFKSYLKKLEELLTEVRAQLAEEKILRPEKQLPDLLEDSVKRQPFGMRDTFNMTQTSLVDEDQSMRTPMNKTGLDFTEEIKDTVKEELSFTPNSLMKQTVISKFGPASGTFHKKNSSVYNTLGMRSTHNTIEQTQSSVSMGSGQKVNAFKRGRNSF